MTPSSITAVQRTDSSGRPRWVSFCDKVGKIEAFSADEVLPAIEKAIEAQNRGLHAVGWISYEASPGFDPHLITHSVPTGEPLLRFTLFKTSEDGLPKLEQNEALLGPLQPSLSEETFCEKVETIHKAIAQGETYQVNLTYPWTSSFSGCPRSLFRQIRMTQSGRYQAYLEEEDRIILSASPERFFRLENGQITCRPMKGTAKPGDEAILTESLKDRAENVMIVDMIRNDLGQAATPGSIVTPDLFEIESYPSLTQMTSTVTATGPENPLPWLKALFPCASITGAPKRNTMKWIHELEETPRGIYTGCIGGFYADGVTEFNVAIRTLQVTPSTGTTTYGTGCGIVWDSDPKKEYQESILKTAVLNQRYDEVHLLETMRAEPDKGILNLESHLNRLTSSAIQLGFEFDLEEITSKLKASTSQISQAIRIRLTLSTAGELEITSAPLPKTFDSLTFKLDTEPTPSQHPELHHKTTRRTIYEAARARHPESDETLLINERGECMEFCIGNLLIERDDVLMTPALECGLLPGVCRAAYVAEGCTETVITPEDLHTADAIYLINAVRGRVPMKQTP